jgi:flagellar hook-length control protein FliK
MNQLATMIDAELGIDPRTRSSRVAGETESGVDFGQVLLGMVNQDDASTGVGDVADNSHRHKKAKFDSLPGAAEEPVAGAASLAIVSKEMPVMGGDSGAMVAKSDAHHVVPSPVFSSNEAAAGHFAGVETPTALSATTRSATDLTDSAHPSVVEPAAQAAAATKGALPSAATVAMADPSVASGRAPRSTLAQRDDVGRHATHSAVDGAVLAVQSAAIEAGDGSGRPKSKGVSAPGTPNGFIAPAPTTSSPSAGDPVRIATTQHKLLASIETQVSDTRSGAAAGATPSGWSIGSLTREDSAAVLQQPVAAERSLESTLGSEEWQVDLGSQLVAMVEKGDQSAVINLSPVELGPVQIDVAVHEGEVSVAFAAQVAETRTAIEASLPKLREMLAGEGLSLTNSNINNMLSGFSQQRSSSRGGEERSTSRGRFAEPETTVLIQTTPSRIRRSLVDLYA